MFFNFKNKIFHRAIVSVFITFYYLSLSANETQSFTKITHKNQYNCPSLKFEKFIEKYANDVYLQNKFTIFPLQILTTIDSQPEPKQKIEKLTQNKIKFPLIPLETERRKEKLILKTQSIKNDSAIVKLYKEDTGYLVNYFFTKNSCWHLVKIEDWSI